MARDILNYNGQVIPPDSDYPNGRIKDNTGGNNGTAVDEKSNGDLQQFFAKMMREANVTYNNLPDNEYSGNQFFEALRKSCRTYYSSLFNITQTGTNDPVTYIGEDENSLVGFSRTGVGIYLSTNQFNTPTGNGTFISITAYCKGGSTTGFATAKLSATSPSFSIEIRTYDSSGTLSDDVLSDACLEIKVMK